MANAAREKWEAYKNSQNSESKSSSGNSAREAWERDKVKLKSFGTTATATAPSTQTVTVPEGNGYFSLPELGADTEKLYSYTKDLENALTDKTKSIESLQGSLEKKGESLALWENQMKVLQGSYQASPTEQTWLQYSKVKSIYDRTYKEYEDLYSAYTAAYDEIAPLQQQYESAVTAYNDYITQQQGVYDAWRGRVRDVDTIQAEIAEIDAKITEQKEADRAAYEQQTRQREQEKPWYEKLAGYLGEVQDTTLPTSTAASSTSGVPVSAEMQALLDKRALLQEEYDWSEYLKWADYAGAEDFAEKSQYVSRPVEGGVNFLEQFGAYLGLVDGDNATASGWEDPLYEYINGNPDAKHYLTMTARASYGNPTNPIGALLGIAENDESQSQEMTPDEIAIFNYLFATQGEEKAHEYYEYLQKSLNQRERLSKEQQWAVYAKEHPVYSSTLSVLGAPLKGISYLGQAMDYLRDGEIDQNAGYNEFAYSNSAIREAVSEKIENGKWGKVGSFAYQTGMSMADFLFTSAISGGNQALSLAIMGTGAAADTTIDAMDRGLTSGQAFALGTIAGVAEVITEKISIDALLDKTGMGKNALGYILQNTLAEGGEEVGSSLINTFADVLISKDKSQWQQSINAYMENGDSETDAFWKAVRDQAISLGLDALGGMISGAAMGGGSAAISAGSAAITGNKLGNMNLTQEGVQGLLNKGLENPGNTRSNYLANKFQQKQDSGKKLSNFDLGRQYQANAADSKGDTGLDFSTELQRQLTNAATAAPEGGSVELDDPGVQVTDEMWSQAQRLSAVTGRKIVLFTQEATAEGIDNGWYSDGVIHVNTASADPMAQIVAHELTHSVEMADAYGSLKKLVLNRLQSNGVDLDVLRQAKRDLYARNNKTLKDNDAADAEIVAEYVAKNLLTNELSIRNVAQQDPSLGRRILNWLNSLLAKLGGKDAQDAAFVRRARDLYAAALRQTEGSFNSQTAKTQAPAKQTAPVATATAATSVQQNTTGINENMSLAETRQQALDAYNAGEIDEQTLDQILDEIDSQEELNGSGISLEAELNRLNQEPAEQHSISELGSFNDLPIREQNALLRKKPIQLSRKDWAKVNSARMQRYSSLEDSDIPEIDIFYIAEYNKVNLGYSYVIRNYSEDSFSAISKKRIKPKIAEIADLEEQSYGRNEESQRVGKNNVSKGSSERIGAGRSFNSGNRGELRENAGGVAAEGESHENLGHWKGNADSGAGRGVNENTDAQHSISAPAERQSIIRDLRSILDRGGDPNELRRYVTQLEQGTQGADQTASVSGREGTEAQRILQAARDRGIGVEEYLEQNWERYDVDGQWNDAARQALELEQGQSRRQHSISAPVNRMTDADIQAVQNIGRISVNQFSAADIQATKRFAQQYWKEMGVKSPFFRAWFGDWRANDQTPVQIATKKGNTRGVQINSDTGWAIQVSGVVFAESQHFAKRNTDAIPYLPYINDIVEKAILLDSYGIESGKAKSSNSLLIHSLYAVADIGGGPEVLKLYVEEMNDPNSADTKKRAYQLQNIEKASAVNGGVQGNAHSSLAYTANAISTVADLFAAVKQKDSNFNPKPASKVINNDGTPMVVYHGTSDDFTEFKHSELADREGSFFFAQNKEDAEAYSGTGKVMEVFVNLQNPIDYNNMPTEIYKMKTKKDQVAALRNLGYDGWMCDMDTGWGEISAFNSNQIKSATDNIGIFDGTDPDIRHSISEAPGAEVTQDIADDFSDENEGDDVRSVLPKKARDYLKRTERTLLNGISRNLGVPWFAQREYLQPIVEEISNEYLKNGTVSKETIDRLFDAAYDEGVVVDREFYDQYKDVKDYLRTTAVTLSESHREDIADFGVFRRNNFGTLRIVNQGGSAVDSVYEELRRMAPELFPADITHPADQLVRMADVGKSIQIAKYSIQYYYGKNADTYRKVARNDFETAIGDVTSELQKVKRYHEERQAGDSALAPTTPEEAMEAYKELKAARRTYEKANAKNLLTQHDEIQLGRLLRGEIELQHLDPAKDNVAGITAVYEAKKEYAQLLKLLADYKQSLRAKQRELANGYLETANDWKDKKAGIAYSRETMVRNVEDIVPDRKLAKQINAEFFEPVAVAEANATRMKDEYRDKVRALGLSTKPAKGDIVSEAHAVQLLGEAQDNIRILEKSRGRIKQRDGKHLSEWREVVNKLWEENPGLDKGKIQNAVDSFRAIYDDLFRKMNEVRVRNGYEPVNYRSGYFPHFQPGDGDGVLAQFGRIMGINTQIDALPTTINGLTHTFKPGIQWFGNAQERLGFNTAYDAVEGFDKYIEGVASVIFHTDNIQKLRALSTQIRYRTSDAGIREQVDAVYADSRLSEEEKQVQINEIYEHGKYALSNFVNELDEYTNLLANKKSKLDRTIESMMGRRVYTFLKAWESRVGANMIAGNLASALTNFIPLVQANAQMDRFTLLQGMWGTLKAYRSGDGLVERSDFLTNRRGSDPLIRTWSQKASGVIGKPMEFIDCFVADSIVRGAYYQNLKRGLSAEDALHQADLFAARVMADRSKGAMPTLFSSVNPVFKAFTQFQLEVNNQFSEVFKDLPRGFKEKSIGALTVVLLKYFLGAWLFNELYEILIGRRPALDPIGILNEAAGDLTGYEIPNLFDLGIGLISGDAPSFESKKEGLGGAVKNLAGNVLEELPFSSGLTLLGVETDGGRIPASSAVPDLTAIWDALTNTEWSPEKRWKEAQDELNKLAYVVTPFGGNQISKAWKGVKAFIQGGSYNVDAEGNDILQYPVYQDDFWGLVRAMIMGKNSLPQAQEWVDSGFDGLNAKQTAAYQDMVDADVDPRDAFSLLQEIDVTKEPEDKRAILQASDISGDGKAIVYYGLLATDTERELMDQLTDLGADAGEVTNTLIEIRDTSSLEGSEGTKAERNAIIESALSDEEKTVLVGDMLGTEMKTESGEPSQYAKFLNALDTGMDVDTYLKFRNDGGGVDQYLKLTDAGLKSTQARELALKLGSLEPTEGTDRVSSAQKWRAAVDISDNADDQITALSAVMSDSQYEKVKEAYSFGIVPEAYVQLAEIKPMFDADGNGSYTQAEVEAAIDAMDDSWADNPLLALSGQVIALTTEQKGMLWQIVTGAKSAKNNPYSVAAGQRVLNGRGED